MLASQELLFSHTHFHIWCLCNKSEADPGFTVRGGADPRGAPTYDFVKFSEKLHEIKKILDRRGAPPPNPPLQVDLTKNHQKIKKV